MRALVTGCAGFLGSHLCDAMLAAGHEVGGVDSLLGGDPENVPDGVRFRRADCCDLEAMTAAVLGCEIVYHLAAFPHEGLSVFSPCVVTQHTYFSTVVTATAAIRAGVKRLVFTSSMARYGKGPLPFTEDMEPRPVDPYGIAKVAAEQALTVLGRQHGMEVVVAVPHNIAGPRQKYDDPFRNVAAIFVNLMLQGRQPYIYGDGQQRRCFSDVADCVGPLLEMGTRPGMDGEKFNIGPDDNPVTILCLAQLIADLLGLRLRPTFLPPRPCEVREAWPSAAKARRVLSYEPKVPLKDTLRRLIAWVRERGPRPFAYHLPLEIASDQTPATWRERLL